MVLRTLVLVSGDPRKSARPAEAISIAAGVGTWKRTEITLALMKDAVWCLNPWTDELVDTENYEIYLPILKAWDHPILADADSAAWAEMDEHDYLVEKVNQQKLNSLMAGFDRLIKFA